MKSGRLSGALHCGPPLNNNIMKNLKSYVLWLAWLHGVISAAHVAAVGGLNDTSIEGRGTNVGYLNGNLSAAGGGRAFTRGHFGFYVCLEHFIT